MGIAPEPAQPGFSLKGRTLASVLSQTERWHQQLARGRPQTGGDTTNTARSRWAGLPVSNFLAGPVRIEQLLTYEQLEEEGRRQHHCVATYAYSCRRGHCGIFSLTVEGVRALTLEVTDNRTVVQVRGKYNRYMTPTERNHINQWMSEARLIMSKHAGWEEEYA